MLVVQSPPQNRLTVLSPPQGASHKASELKLQAVARRGGHAVAIEFCQLPLQIAEWFMECPAVNNSDVPDSCVTSKAFGG
jgi:hypothetical protein